MPKWLPIHRLLQLRLTRYAWSILCLIAVIQLFAACGHYNYEHLAEDTLEKYLYKHVNPKLVIKKSKPDCKYDEILKSTKSRHTWTITKQYNDFIPKGIMNGSYVPEDCNPVFSVAILVTYRNRQSQLDIFIPYMHNFLRKQNIHYKIYVIEQQDDKPWNKGLLYNIGAKQAIAENFPCLILHDVDLLPLDESNLYACLNQPRHMSASIDKFRFVLIYKTLVGGVLAITSDQYMKLNGFSNRFQGWGGEDDDFATRIMENKLDVLRFPAHMSRYTMLLHAQEAKNTARYEIMSENSAKRNSQKDGLRSIHFDTISVKPHRLFTLIGVRIPTTTDWKIIENGFRNQWHFPGCCGAIDGKHVVIKAPPESGSLYYNYKETNSIVLMAVVDHKYCFSYIDVGCTGRVSDGGVFRNCSLYQELENGILPEGHVLVGDNAFPLKEYLLKPFPGNRLTSQQKIFNYRLSRARRIVENAFGILAARFRVFEKPMPYSPEKVVKIVKTCCALHNWLRQTELQNKQYEYTVDKENYEAGTIVPGNWRNEPESLGMQPLPISLSNRSSQRSTDRRERYANYFVGSGSVSWQTRMIH